MAIFIKFIKKNIAIIITVILLLLSLWIFTISREDRNFNPLALATVGYGKMQNFLILTTDWFSRLFAPVFEAEKIREKYEKLQIELVDYERLTREVFSLSEENRALRSLLDFRTSEKISSKVAQIISHDSSGFYPAILVDRGSEDNILPNQVVTALQDGKYGLVGKVGKVNSSNSVIYPLYSEASFVAGRLAGSRYTGLVQGMGNERRYLLFDFVNKSALADIKKQDMVVTSGTESLFPAEIPIGYILSYSADDWKTSLQIELQPIIDYERLEYVYILSDKTQ